MRTGCTYGSVAHKPLPKTQRLHRRLKRQRAIPERRCWGREAAELGTGIAGGDGLNGGGGGDDGDDGRKIGGCDLRERRSASARI